MTSNMADYRAAELIGRWGKVPGLLPGEEEKAKLFFRNYIFYTPHGRRRSLFCSRCNRRWETSKDWEEDIYQEDTLAREKHGSTVLCTMCGAESEMICTGRMRNYSSITEWVHIGAFREQEGVLWALVGEATRDYCDDDLSGELWFSPKALYAFDGVRRQRWKLEEFWNGNDQKRDKRWKTVKSFRDPFPDGLGFGGACYDGSIGWVGWDELKNSPLRYSMMKEYFEQDVGERVDPEICDHPLTIFGATEYLAKFQQRPQIEMLMKLGHKDVVCRAINGNDLNGVNWKARSPHEFFGMSKKDYKVFREQGAKLSEYEEWSKGKGEMPFSDFIVLKRELGDSLEKVAKRSNRIGAEVSGVIRYLRKQKMPLKTAAQLWIDTIDMEEKLERNIRFKRYYMPEELRSAHDDCVKMLEEIREQDEKKGYTAVFRRLKSKYEWYGEGYFICVPKSADEIQKEGEALRHCVAGYAQRHIKGKTVILFMRKESEKDKPYITIEMCGNNIVQIHGFRNDVAVGAKSPMDKHGDIINEWLRWLSEGSPKDRRGRPLRERKEKTE